MCKRLRLRDDRKTGKMNADMNAGTEHYFSWCSRQNRCRNVQEDFLKNGFARHPTSPAGLKKLLRKALFLAAVEISQEEALSHETLMEDLMGSLISETPTRSSYSATWKQPKRCRGGE